jgi:hypothetical protein
MIFDGLPQLSLGASKNRVEQDHHDGSATSPKQKVEFAPLSF